MVYISIFICICIGITALFLFIVSNNNYLDMQESEPDETSMARAGRRGERKAEEIIKQILYEDDILLTNICISYGEREAELDNVIINNRGVFVIEVKNYSGTLIGGEDDYEWKKYKISKGGNIYEKQVRNPIKQVKRQVYILSQFMKYYGINVWIDGYVMLLNRNSPIQSDLILESLEEIDRAIHKKSRNSLNKKTVAAIKELL